MRKEKSKKNESNELEGIKVYSEDIIKNLVMEVSESSKNNEPSEKQYEEDFYTREIHKPHFKNTSAAKKRKLEKYKYDFFENNYEDEEAYEKSSPSLFRAISITCIVLLSISTAILGANLFSTKSELSQAKAQVQSLAEENNNIEKKFLEEDLKNEINKLQEENAKLKQDINKPSEEKEEAPSSSSTDAPSAPSVSSNTSNPSSNNSSASNNKEYIVQTGDSIWIISKKVYGNGAQYQKILNANNLTENSTLQEGQKLIIP